MEPGNQTCFVPEDWHEPTRDLRLSRNASRAIKPGDHVDVVIGTLRAKPTDGKVTRAGKTVTILGPGGRK
jgi:hypothetical protein